MRFQIIERCRQAISAFRIHPDSEQARFIQAQIIAAMRKGNWADEEGAARLAHVIFSNDEWRTADLGGNHPELAGTTSHPDYEHWTCGTEHIKAERLLRIIEKCAPSGVKLGVIQELAGLIYQAGPAYCRRALVEFPSKDEVPF